MSKLLLRIIQANQKFNKFFNLPIIISFDPSSKHFTCHGSGTRRGTHFFIFYLIVLISEFLKLIFLALNFLVRPQMRMSLEKKLVLILDAAIAFPVSSAMFVALSVFGRDMVTIENWSLQSNKKLGFQQTPSVEKKLVPLFLEGWHLYFYAPVISTKL